MAWASWTITARPVFFTDFLLTNYQSMLMASFGQTSTHAPQSPQESWSTTAVPFCTEIEPNGQESTHSPQPLHFSASIFAAIKHSPRLLKHSRSIYFYCINPSKTLLDLSPGAKHFGHWICIKRIDSNESRLAKECKEVIIEPIRGNEIWKTKIVTKPVGVLFCCNSLQQLELDILGA